MRTAAADGSSRNAREVASALPFQDAARGGGPRKLGATGEATGIDRLAIDLPDFTPTRRWIERLGLVDSPRLLHPLRLLRDLFEDEELRARVERACSNGNCAPLADEALQTGGRASMPRRPPAAGSRVRSIRKRRPAP